MCTFHPPSSSIFLMLFDPLPRKQKRWIWTKSLGVPFSAQKGNTDERYSFEVTRADYGSFFDAIYNALDPNSGGRVVLANEAVLSKSALKKFSKK